MQSGHAIEWHLFVPSSVAFALCSKGLVKLIPDGVNFVNILSAPFAPIFLGQYFCAKKLQSQNITIEKLSKALLYKKIMEQNVDEIDSWLLLLPKAHVH